MTTSPNGLPWVNVEFGSSEFCRVIECLFVAYPEELNPDRTSNISFRLAELPCYDRVSLVSVFTKESEHNSKSSAYALIGPDFVRYVSGGGDDLDAINIEVAPNLPTEASTYMRLALVISCAGQKRQPVEDPFQLSWTATPNDSQLNAVADIVRPLAVAAPDAHQRVAIFAIMQAKGALYELRYLLWPDGLLQEQGETLLLSDEALAEPPAFTPFSALRGTVFAVQSAEGAVGVSLELTGTRYTEITKTYEILEDDMDEENDEDPIPPAADVTSNASGWKLGDVFGQLAGILLNRAVCTEFPSGLGERKESDFFAYVKQFRPTIVIETPYRDLRNEFAQYIGRGCDLGVNARWEVGADSYDNRPQLKLGGEEVVLLTNATFTPLSSGRDTDVWTLLAPLIRGPHVTLIVTERTSSLPQDVRDMIDLTLHIPRMDEAMFWLCSNALFNVALVRTKADWARYVLPRDMARVATATRDQTRYIAELEATIARRLAQYTAPDAPSLTELQGLGEAKYRMEELAADIQGALKGTIGWHQVDRGYLLVGPPGTGKTTLVRALAKDCGIRFVLASASSWQEQSSLGPHVQSIRNSFREARLYAPAILFIDEIDSLGSRTRTEAQNSQYQTVVINTVLEELQGFDDREGVIVIGATNNPENVDEALRRPGRLDRIIQVPYPNVAALAAIYEFYLQRALRDGVTLGDIDRQRLAQLTFGRTGAHVELYIRGAVRRVRRENRAEISEADIVAEITARPPEGFQMQLSQASMRRVAVHESGHALVAMTGLERERDVPMVTIIPRANGSLGFIARAPGELGAMTRAEMEESIRVTLGGRAAEEMIFGRDDVSGGAGGSANSDLGCATQAIICLLTEFGYSNSGGLLWIDWDAPGASADVTADAIRNLPLGEEILREARAVAQRLYKETLLRLKANRPALERVIAALIERQELAAPELRALVEGRR